MSEKITSTTAAATRSRIVLDRTYRASADELWELWTTKEGFESWWPPEGFRAVVHAVEARVNGKLHYDMIADTPELVATTIVLRHKLPDASRFVQRVASTFVQHGQGTANGPI